MTASGKPAAVRQLITPGTQAKRMIERDRESVSRAYHREHPLVVMSGQGTDVIDNDGNRYLDFTSGHTALSVGHCHPQIVAAIRAQSAQYIHTTTSFYHEPWVQLSEELATLKPFQEEATVYLCASPVQAKEMAMKVAASYTGRKHFLEFVAGSSSHGANLPVPPITRRIPTSLHSVTPIPFPNPYRPLFATQGGEDEIGTQVLDYLETVVLRSTMNAEEIAGVIVEPIHEESGNVVPPPSFLPGLREVCDRHGMVLIADEEVSGMGRTGRWWATGHWNVEPDIVCIARGTAGGMPIGGLLMRKRLDRLAPNIYENTFGGNPLTCAAALATLALLRKVGIDNAVQEGFYLQETLNLIARHHPTIGQIRGRGLLLGVEFVWNREDREPAMALRNRVNQRCFEHGLLVVGCGESTTRLIPPLTVTRDEIDEALTIFEYALTLAEAELLRGGS
ncbi:MAG TPA: aminotransferase class III-fold pyridoxal phosphate-dependent enzyme [Caldilineaceae bacterium]|nr:aminotransferase class III-fold pyridoxal phosphate-dependent enzyme [Caldilineaceae bacterium]